MLAHSALFFSADSDDRQRAGFDSQQMNGADLFGGGTLDDDVSAAAAVLSGACGYSRQGVSLIATVFNDLRGTMKFLQRMEEQTRRPDEMVVCDAGSTDGTWQVLQRHQSQGSIPLVLLREERCRPARGRNLAAMHARHSILAVTDIGCDWDPEWLEELVAPFESGPDVEAVLGSWKVRWEEQRTAWAKAHYALHNGLEFRAAPKSLAANRSIAYRKEFYLRLGGLPEDLTFAADDTSLALLIQAMGRRISAAPKPRCYWERPQTFSALTRESRRNFYGDGEAGINVRHIVLVGGRLLLECVAVCAFLVATLAVPGTRMKWFLAMVTGMLLLWRTLRINARRLAVARRGADASLIYMVVLDYALKVSSVTAYVLGWFNGNNQCANCRERLRSHKIGSR